MTPHHRPGFMTGIAPLLPITLTTMAIVLLAPVIPDLMVQFAHVPNHEYSWSDSDTCIPLSARAAARVRILRTTSKILILVDFKDFDIC